LGKVEYSLFHFEYYIHKLYFLLVVFITLAASSDMSNVTVWRPFVRLSVCFSRLFLILRRAAHTQRDLSGAARDAASVHFCLSITNTRMDLFVFVVVNWLVSNVFSMCIVGHYHADQVTPLFADRE